jgi:hypothetical protein
MKRSMYGRGGFELVRQRVLNAALLLSTKDAEDPDSWYHHTHSSESLRAMQTGTAGAGW